MHPLSYSNSSQRRSQNTTQATATIADWLAGLLPGGRPRRVARMLPPGGDKYRDVSRHVPLDTLKLRAHADGGETWACTLDASGMSQLGVIEVDHGGQLAVTRTLEACAASGLRAWAIAVDNPLSGHAGGHVWVIYDAPAPVAAIVAQLRTVATRAGLPSDTEIWPRSQVIRLPFGYHRWAQTRGDLISPIGEIFHLDDTSERAAALVLVQGLLPNDAPPALSTDVDIPKSVTAVTVRRVSPGELAVEQASLASVKAAYNRAHKLSSLLEQGPGGLYFCPCGQHSSGKPKIAIWETAGEERAQSYSPDCALFPLHRSGKHLTAFDYYVATEHGGNVTTALKALNPITRANPAPVRDLPDYLTPAEAEKRQQEAQRKRTARHQGAVNTRADVRTRAAADATLRASDRAVLEALLTIAGDRAWCRPSKERIAEVSGLGLGTVKRALFSQAKGGRLEGRYFISEGDGGGPNTTAIRTFLRGSIAPKLIPMLDLDSDSESDSRSCERGGAGPAAVLERLSFASYLRNLAGELGELLDLEKLAALEQAELEQIEAQLLERLADVDQVPPAAAELADGACYIPALDWTAGGRLDLAGWRDPLELRPIVAGDVDEAQIAPAELLDLTPAPEPEPLVRSAPTEPAAAREYWALKHKKPVNYKQASWIRNRLAALEIWIPVSQALALEPPPAPAIAVRQPRRRAAAAAPLCAHIPAGEQLTLELPMGNRPELPIGNRAVELPIGNLELAPANRAQGFAPASVASTPPLTSSPRSGRHAPP